MKIKNIITGGMAAFAVLLVLLVPEDVFADRHGGGSGPFNCTCGGLGTDYTYYKCPERIYYNCILIHEFDTSGNVIDRHFSYPKCSAEDLCYWVVRVQVGADGTKTIVPSRIIISEDTNITLYDDHNGTTKTLTYSQYSGLDKGNYNGKYYFLDSSYIFMTINESTDNGYEVLWSGDWNYIVESDDSYNDIVDLAIWLCGGEDVDIPDSVTAVTPLPVYDLEPPLNVSVNGIDNNFFETKSKSVKIRWEQSNIDLTGYKTVFYMRESGRCRKTIFNEWQDVKTPWLFDKKYVTARYCNNNLKYHEYKWWTDQSKLGDYANAALYGEETGGLMCEHAAVDFMIRNEKEDADGTLHYSSWVYLNCFEDGTYQIYEMNEDYTLDEDPDETGNINTDSSIYDDEKVYDEDDVDASLGIGDAKDFVGGMTDLINSLRSFPSLFSKIFSFFPSWVLAMIGMLFIAALVSRIFL